MSENFDEPNTRSGLFFRILDFVEEDDKHGFVRLINRIESSNKKGAIIWKICDMDAANCLAAILDDEAGDPNLVNIYLSVVENVPLHAVARGARIRIASLLLDRGFSPDLPTDYYDYPPVCLKNALPINVSLDYARSELWNHYKVLECEPWKSPIHQIMKYCQYWSYIAVARLIARKMTKIKHEFLKYLKQGKVFEVGALLAIASDLILSPSSTIDGENGSIGFKNIMEMRQFLSAEMSRSLGASNTQLKEINKTLRLLEIFDRIGDKLVQHMPMWDENAEDAGIKVASLLKDAAYDEKAEDEYDHDAVPCAYYKPITYLTPPSAVKSTTSPNVIKSSPVHFIGGEHPNCMRKFSTKVHPSWLKEGRCHVDAPLPLPTTLKSTVTKHVLSKKHASFIGAFAKAVRHLRYC